MNWFPNLFAKHVLIVKYLLLLDVDKDSEINLKFLNNNQNSYRCKSHQLRKNLLSRIKEKQDHDHIQLKT